MSGVWYCLDNDIILKLATFNIFDKTLTALNTSYSQVCILETAKYKFRNLQKSVKKPKRGEHSGNYDLEAAINITASCSKVSAGQVNQDILINFQNIEGIDAGELILIGHVSSLNQQGNLSYLLTGDKRCLRALAACGITEITQYLDNQVWCLEQLILKNIEKYGFDFVKEIVLQGVDCDTALKSAFGSGQQATLESTKETLLSYIRDLRQQTGKLLNAYPN